jgi:hypothetical protein
VKVVQPKCNIVLLDEVEQLVGMLSHARADNLSDWMPSVQAFTASTRVCSQSGTSSANYLRSTRPANVKSFGTTLNRATLFAVCTTGLG